MAVPENTMGTDPQQDLKTIKALVLLIWMTVGELFPQLPQASLVKEKSPQVYRSPEVFCSSAAWRRDMRRWKKW